MNWSGALNVAIGLTLVYLAFSVAASRINEFVASQLQWRADGLERALYTMLVLRVGSSFTLRLGQDGIGVLGPEKRFAALVPAVDEAADGIDELADGVEAAAADRLAGDDSEEDLHQVQPGSRRRGEVQRDPRVAGQPGLDLGVLVGGVVVADDVQPPPRVGLGDLLEETQELLVAVPGLAGVDDLAGGHLQGGEQRGGAVADVVVGGLLRHPGHDRQDRRG